MKRRTFLASTAAGVCASATVSQSAAGHEHDHHHRTFATPAEAARQAVENDVHIIGVSSLAAGHLTLVPDLMAALKAEGRGDILIVVGGVIPPADYPALLDAGAKAVFGPGTNIPKAAADLMDKLNASLGYAPKAAAE